MQFIDRNNRLLDSVGNSLHSRADLWLAHHPLINWLFQHPLISAIAAAIATILIIRLFLTIYRAIASTIDRIWLWILRSPWLLLKLLFGWEFKPKPDENNTTITNYEITENSQQLQDILVRLEQIQQQQQQILQDIASLKGQSPKTIDLQQSLIEKKLPPSS